MVLVAEGAVSGCCVRGTGRSTRRRFPRAVTSPPPRSSAGASFSDGQLWLFAATLGAEGAVLVALALGQAGDRPAPSRATRGPPDARRGRGRRRPLDHARRRDAACRGSQRTSAPSTTGSRPRGSARGSATSRSRRRSAPCLAAAGAALLLALAPPLRGSLVDPRDGGRGGDRASCSSGWRRWSWPRSSTSSRRCRPTSPARAEVLDLATTGGGRRRARSTASTRAAGCAPLNAYVDGIGSTKRVVLYDNLLRRANRPELEASSPTSSATSSTTTFRGASPS